MKITVYVSLLLAACVGPAHAAGLACEDIVKIKLPATEITAATLVARGAFPAPPGQNGQVQPQAAAMYAGLPAFCRVQATLRPSADSDIKVEVWLPQDNFNGRLQAIGNGGFSSSIGLGNLAQGVAGGYAMVGSNTGHEGNSGAVMIGHPEKLSTGAIARCTR